MSLYEDTRKKRTQSQTQQIQQPTAPPINVFNGSTNISGAFEQSPSSVPSVPSQLTAEQAKIVLDERNSIPGGSSSGSASQNIPVASTDVPRHRVSNVQPDTMPAAAPQSVPTSGQPVRDYTDYNLLAQRAKNHTPDEMPGRTAQSSPTAEEPMHDYFGDFVGEPAKKKDGVNPDAMPGKSAPARTVPLEREDWPIWQAKHDMNLNPDAVPSKASADKGSAPIEQTQMPSDYQPSPLALKEDTPMTGEQRWKQAYDSLMGDGWNEHSKDPFGKELNGYTPKENPQGTKSSLDEVLYGSNTAPEGKKNVPEFKKDTKKKDGGFFRWLKDNFGDKKKDGETDEEYDYRVTQNRKKMAIFTDMLRQFGNIINTNKGGLSQTFNDPVAAVEAGYQQRKAVRDADKKAEADRAYKAAKLEGDNAKNAADAAYKAQILELKKTAEERAKQKAEDDAKQREKTNQRNADNDAFNHDLMTKKFEEAKRNNRDRINIARGNLAIAQHREARATAKQASGGGSGGSGSLTNLATPDGRYTRKKDLSAVEKKQIWNEMVKEGLITEQYMQNNYTGRTIQEQGAAINFAIGYAMSDKKNSKFREYMRLHHGYTPVNTVPTTTQSAKGGGRTETTRKSAKSLLQGGPGK